MPTQTEQETRWMELCDFINEWFARPDIEALRITMAVARAHFCMAHDPVWIQVVGPSGCGKTTLFIRCLEGFPRAFVMGDITPNTFLSAKRGKKQSFLDQIGSNAVLLFKDFTTFLSKRPEDRLTIASQLREIHDGEWVKNTGESGRQRWTGKITAVAACTPAVDKAWAVMRDLGERFTTVRVQPPSMTAISAKKRKKGRNGPAISKRLRELVHAVASVPSTGSLPPIPESFYPQLDALGEFVACVRQHVERSRTGKHEITDISAIEVPTRILNAIDTVVSANADLFGRDVIPEDVKLAERLAIDSIPPIDWRIIRALPPGGLSASVLAESEGIQPSVIVYHAAALKAIGVLRTNSDWTDDFLCLDDSFCSLRDAALPSMSTS